MSHRVLPFMPSLNSRHIAVAATVLAAHAGVLWLLQAGLQNRPSEQVLVSAEILAEWMVAAPPPPAQAALESPPTPPATRVDPRPPAPRPVATPTQPPASRPPLPALPPTVQTEPLPSEADSSASASALAAPATSGTEDESPSSVTRSETPSTPTPPRIELPSAAARYLDNPPPRYPPLSRRLGEQGTVVLRVRIEANGTASAAEVRTSSGYSRLDDTARQTVLNWRYVPGTRNGVPEAMWFNIPINFILE